MQEHPGFQHVPLKRKPCPKSPARRPTQHSTPARSQAGDLTGKYGARAVSQVIPSGSNSVGDGPCPPPGDSTLGRLSHDRSPRSESLCPVERPSSCDTGHNARLVTKGSVQRSPVNRPVYSEHALVTPGPGKPGNGPLTGTRYSVPPTTPGKLGTVTTLGTPITPGSPSSAVTLGESVRPVQTGQKAQLEKADQCLTQSELPVLNSRDTSVQLEHNVHEQPGNMPNLQIEHLSEHSQVFQDFTISDSPDVRADETQRTHLQDSGHLSSGIGHTGNPLGAGHTGNCLDHEHSVHRSRSVRSDAIEHGSDRTRHRSDVSRSSRRDSLSHRETIPLRHADPGELSPASLIRHRPARSRSSSYDSVSPTRHSRSTSRSRGKKKKSHKKRKHSSTSSSSSRRSSSYSSRERESKQHKSKRRRRNTLNHVRPNVTSVRRSTRGRGVLLHLLLLHLLQFLQTLLLLLGEAQPERSLELILGLLLRLMTILIPLLGLRARHHTEIISVYVWIMMTNLIRLQGIIRT